MELKSKVIADCGNLSLDISNLICEFLILKPINKQIACSMFVFSGIKGGKILVCYNSPYHHPRKKGFISISVDGRICVALHLDGTLEILLKFFKSNYFRWKYYSPDDRFVNITAVNEDVIAIRSDGSIKSMKKGEIKKKGFVMFTKGTSMLHKNVIGLKNDGTIEYLDLADNDNLPEGSDYVSIASGRSHILTLKSDGTLYSKTFISKDEYGVISDTPKGDNFIAIDACYHNSAALTDDGIIHLWGDYNRYGKMGEIVEKDCIDIAISDRIIIGLMSNGDIVKYLLPDMRDKYGSRTIRSYKV